MPVSALIPALALGGAGAAAAIAGGGKRSAERTLAGVAQEELAIRREILNLIKPFATQLLQLGINPEQILQSPLGAALLRPEREATAREFAQARTNLIDALAGRGISPGSGIAVGPLANLFSQEALAQSALLGQLPLRALELAFQGGNLLTGQQAAFNPQNTLSVLAGLRAAPSPFARFLENLPGAIGVIIGKR